MAPDPKKNAAFIENVNALEEVVENGDVPAVEMTDPQIKEIVQDYGVFVNEKVDDVLVEALKIINTYINDDDLPEQSVPRLIRSFTPQPSKKYTPDPRAFSLQPKPNQHDFANLSDVSTEVQEPVIRQLQLKRSSEPLPKSNQVSQISSKQSLLEIQELLERQQLLGGARKKQTHENTELENSRTLHSNSQLLEALSVENYQSRGTLQNVSENIDENIYISQAISKQTTKAAKQMEVLQADLAQTKDNLVLLFSEVRNITEALNQGKEQGEQIKEGVLKVNQGIGRLEVAVSDVGQNVTGMRGEVRVRFDQAEVQVREFRDFAAQRFDDVITQIHRIGTYDHPCELKYNEGYGKFFNSLVWCIWVFLRFLTVILTTIIEIYYEFKRRFLALIPENVAGVPIRWLIEMALGLMEFGGVLLVLDKYIGPLIGIPNLANKFFVKGGVFIFQTFIYVFNIICVVWDTLTSTIRTAIVELGDEIGLWYWLENLWVRIYAFFTSSLASAMVEAKKQASEIATEAVESAYTNTIGQIAVPDLGLYNALGWNTGEIATEAAQSASNTASIFPNLGLYNALGWKGGKGKKHNLYGGAEIPLHLIHWMETAQQNNFLDLINISSLLNQAVFYNVVNYFTTLELGIKDPTFISFLSTNSQNILTFQKNANHLYYVLKENGIFEIMPMLRESSRVEMLTSGGKKTHRRFYKYKKNSSRKVRTRKTKKNKKQQKNKKFNKVKSKNNK